MANPEVIEEAIIATDATAADTLCIPDGSIGNEQWSTDTARRLSASKKVHQKYAVWSTATPSTTLAATTETIYTCNSTTTLEALTVRPETVPTGGDLAYQVDVQWAADGSTSYATVQSGTINFTSSETDGTKKSSPGLTKTAFARGDTLQVVVTVSGSTGTQGAGATLLAVLSEQPY